MERAVSLIGRIPDFQSDGKGSNPLRLINYPLIGLNGKTLDSKSKNFGSSPRLGAFLLENFRK